MGGQAYLCLKLNVCSVISTDLVGTVKALSFPPSRGPSTSTGAGSMRLRVKFITLGTPQFGPGRAARLCPVEWDIVLPPTLM